MHLRQQSYVSVSRTVFKIHPCQTYLFVALLLPLGDQVAVGVAIFEQPVVQRFADGFFLVIQIVYVPGACRWRQHIVRRVRTAVKVQGQ